MSLQQFQGQLSVANVVRFGFFKTPTSRTSQKPRSERSGFNLKTFCYKRSGAYMSTYSNALQKLECVWLCQLGNFVFLPHLTCLKWAQSGKVDAYFCVPIRIQQYLNQNVMSCLLILQGHCQSNLIKPHPHNPDEGVLGWGLYLKLLIFIVVNIYYLLL